MATKTRVQVRGTIGKAVRLDQSTVDLSSYVTTAALTAALKSYVPLSTGVISNTQGGSSSGGGGGGTTYTGADSVSVSGSVIELVNDTSSPGANYVYGTNGSGTRGWYSSPSLSSPGNNYYYGTNGSGTKGWYSAANLGVSEMSAGWNSVGAAVVVSLTAPQDLVIPFNCTLKEVAIVTQGGTGSCTVQLWKAASLGLPNSDNDITGGAPPAISSGTSYDNTTLSGDWTTSFSKNDRILCTLSASAVFTSVKIILRMQ